MNRMTKKIVAGVAFASLAFGLVACGDDSSSTVLVVGDDTELSSSSIDAKSSSSAEEKSSSSVEEKSSSSTEEKSSSSVEEKSSSSTEEKSSSSEEAKSSSSVEEVSSSSEEAKLALTGAVFGSDYTTGELRWIDADGKISTGSLAFFQDSRVVANGSDLYVLESMGADNITLIDAAKLSGDGKDAIVWQASLDDGSNPVDMAFDGNSAWVALQNADSLVKISTADGKVVKSIKTGKFSYEGEKSPYVADIELNDGKLYVLMQRYTMDAATWVTTYPKGILAIYDAESGELKDTVVLATQNPTAMAFDNGKLYVATKGEYNASYGTDADDKRGIELVDLSKKSSSLVISGEKIGAGVHAFVVEKGIGYVAVYKGYGTVPLAKVDLAKGSVETIEGIADAEGSIVVKDGVVYVGDRSYGNEKVLVYKNGDVTGIDQPEGALAPYNITLF